MSQPYVLLQALDRSLKALAEMISGNHVDLLPSGTFRVKLSIADNNDGNDNNGFA